MGKLRNSIAEKSIIGLFTDDFTSMFGRLNNQNAKIELDELNTWRRSPQKPTSSVLHVLTLALITETTTLKWTEISDFTKRNQSTLEGIVNEFDKPYRPGYLYNKLNSHLILDDFIEVFCDWTSQLYIYSDGRFNKVTKRDAEIAKNVSTRVSWQVLSIIRLWSNTNKEHKNFIRLTLKIK